MSSIILVLFEANTRYATYMSVDIPLHAERRIFSIGHSNLPLEHFIALLKAFQVTVVVDTRSHPLSKHAPHFNREPLCLQLNNAGLKYVFMGKELGGRPRQPHFYDSEGRVLYGRVAETEDFQVGIQRLLTGIDRFRVALLCSEEDPRYCHRNLLVGRVLKTRGVDVLHIRKSGILERDADLENRLTPQYRIFGNSEDEWKSAQSVLLRKLQNSSSRR